MKKTGLEGLGKRGLLAAALAGFFLLHQDIWFWEDARLVLGLPVGLAYHLGYSLAASLLMALMVRRVLP